VVSLRNQSDFQFCVPTGAFFPVSSNRVILHLDMDAFFASIEQRDRPELAGQPVIVGGSPESRGVVCAASYEARQFGVRSAMPSRTAQRMCPRAVFLSPRMDRYKEESREIFKRVAEAGLTLEQVSVDEAYLEATERFAGVEMEEALLQAVPLARTLKSQIRKERSLTASVGIGGNKLMAKLASDYGKPDGLCLIPHRDRTEFLRLMPVRVLHGVGKVTEETLARVGLRTVGDLQEYAGDLRALVGALGPVLQRFAFGEDDRALSTDETIKSISTECTFGQDTEHRPTLRATLREQAKEIAEKLQRNRLEARTVQVKVRYSNFTTLTRQFSGDQPVTGVAEIYRLACWLLGRERLVSRPLRLLGLGVSGLREISGIQMALSL
jgi:DNA polymerase IV